MMGQLPRMESLFYYFRLQDQIHLLRLIDCYVDLSFIRDRLKNLYNSVLDRRRELLPQRGVCYA